MKRAVRTSGFTKISDGLKKSGCRKKIFTSAKIYANILKQYGGIAQLVRALR